MHGPHGEGEAKIVFGDSQFKVVKPGAFVRCAFSGVPIPLEDLRYWSVERQEGYATGEIALAAEETARGPSRET